MLDSIDMLYTYVGTLSSLQRSSSSGSEDRHQSGSAPGRQFFPHDPRLRSEPVNLHTELDGRGRSYWSQCSEQQQQQWNACLPFAALTSEAPETCVLLVRDQSKPCMDNERQHQLAAISAVGDNDYTFLGAN